MDVNGSACQAFGLSCLPSGVVEIDAQIDSGTDAIVDAGIVAKQDSGIHARRIIEDVRSGKRIVEVLDDIVLTEQSWCFSKSHAARLKWRKELVINYLKWKNCNDSFAERYSRWHFGELKRTVFLRWPKWKWNYFTKDQKRRRAIVERYTLNGRCNRFDEQRMRTLMLLPRKFLRRNNRTLLEAGVLSLRQSILRKLLAKLRTSVADTDEVTNAMELNEIAVEGTLQHVFAYRFSCQRQFQAASDEFGFLANKMLGRVEDQAQPSLVDLCGTTGHSDACKGFFYEFGFKYGPINKAIPLKGIDEIGVQEDEMPNEKSGVCDFDHCLLLEEYVNPLREFLTVAKKCRDLRRLFGRGLVIQCDHFKGVRRCTELDKPLDSKVCEESDLLPQLSWKCGYGLGCLDSDRCKSTELMLRRLGLHFHDVRELSNYFDRMVKMDKLLLRIDQALHYLEFETMEALQKEYMLAEGADAMDFNFHDEFSKLLDEKEIGNWEPGKLFLKCISEMPKHVCFSCRMLHYRKDVVEYKVVFSQQELIAGMQVLDYRRRDIQLPPNYEWAKVAKKAREDGFDLDKVFVCRFCKSSLHKGKVQPSRCVLNNLEVKKVPSNLKPLNDVEKMLVSRAKCFQTIFRLGSVGSKLPQSDKVRCQKGQVVSFPLPMCETLRTVNRSFLEFPKDDLHIVVNGKPTRNGVIWQSVVDFAKLIVWIHFLCRNNPLYKDVVLEKIFGSSLSDEETQRQRLADYVMGNLSKENDLEYVSVVDASNRCREFLNVSAGDNVVFCKEDEKILREESRKSMLSKVENVEEYEQLIDKYTVQSIHRELPDVSDLDLYQMETVESDPLSSRVPDLDTRCFPNLFLDGRGGENAHRRTKLTFSQFVKTKLENADPRFRRDHQYVFFLLHCYRRRAVFQGMRQMMNNDPRFVGKTAGEILSLVNSRDRTLENSIRILFSQIRGSGEYWAKRRQELKAMVSSLGPPCWFFTCSFAEYAWDDMQEMLIEMNKDLSSIRNMRLGERCAMDPVMTCKHGHKRFQDFFNTVILTKNNPPLGEVIDYMWRVEYQARGAPHYHMVLWVKDSPKFGESSEEEILHFIQQYVTCRLPCPKKAPVMCDRVERFQRHRCRRNYCLRVYLNGRRKYTKCRFHFPRRPRDSAVLRDPIVSFVERKHGGGNCRLYELPRKEEECNINDYSPKILMTWQANHDIQWCGFRTDRIVNYLASYICKKELAQIQEIWQEVSKDRDLHKALFCLGMRAVTLRECGIYEAIDMILSQPLYSKSVAVRYVNIRVPARRCRQLKAKKAIENLPGDSHECFMNNWISDYYPNRPVELEDCCLYEFMRWYEKIANKTSQVPMSVASGGFLEDEAVEDEQAEGEDECGLEKKTLSMLNNLGNLRKRKKPNIISHAMFNPMEQPDDYYYGLLLLFRCFRLENTELVPDGCTVKEAFELELERNDAMKAYHERLESDRLRVEEEELKRQQLEEEKRKDMDAQQLEPEFVGMPFQAADAMRELDEMQRVVSGKNKDLQYYLSNFNDGQRRAFCRFVARLDDPNGAQMLAYLNGAGGCGKSFLLDGLRAYIDEKNKQSKEEKRLVVGAPTGVAAWNCGGMTLHRIFQIPVKNDQTRAYEPLREDAISELRRQLAKVVLICIDEISMVSNYMLMFLHLRLVEIFRNPDRPFAGKHVIVMGDFMQLPPVREPFIFKDIPWSQAFKLFGSIGFKTNIWTDMFTMYEELTKIERQSGDEEYGQLLNRLRFGAMNEEDVQRLQERLIPVAAGKNSLETFLDYYEQLISEGKSVVCLIPNLENVKLFNEKMMARQAKEVVRIPALDSFLGVSEFLSKRKKDCLLAKLRKKQDHIADTAGLESILVLCKGARVMNRRNTNVELGVVNGSLGTVTGFDVVDGEVESIFVKFDRVDEVQGMKRVSAKFPLEKTVQVERRQFSLIQSWACTTHKSQSLSLDEVLADCGQTVFESGMTYVTLSRVKSLAGLYLMNFSPSHAKANADCIREINRLRRLQGLQEEEIPIVQNSFRVARERIWYDLSKIKKTNKRKLFRLDVSVDEPSIKKTKRAQKENRKKRFSSGRKDVEEFEFNVGNVKWPRFKNYDGVSCYANSVLQVLFSSESFMRRISSFEQEQGFHGRKRGAEGSARNVRNETVKLRLNYVTRKLRGGQALVCRMLREALGNPFNLCQQQDASEFLEAILNRLNLGDLAQIELIRHTLCMNGGVCEWSTEAAAQREMVNSCNIPHSLDFSDLFVNVQVVDGMHCPDCGGDVQSYYTFDRTSELAIVRLNRHTGYPENVFDNRPLRNLDVDNINLGGERFFVQGVIYHSSSVSLASDLLQESRLFESNALGEKELIVRNASVSFGHYVSIVRRDEGGWVLCDDHNVSILNEFPKGLCYAVVLLLEKAERAVNVIID